MVEISIESENARFFYKDIADRNNQMVAIIHQYNYYTIVVLSAIWTITGKYVIDDPLSLTVVVISLNISIGFILLWRFLVHEIDNDVARNYSRLVFYEHALTGFKSTPNEQSVFYNLTKNFPRWNKMASVNDWETQYTAFNYLINKNKLGERGNQHFDKIAFYSIGFLLIVDFILYLIILLKYNFFNIILLQGFLSLGLFFLFLYLLKFIFLYLIIKNLFDNCRQLEPTYEDIKMAFTNPSEREMIEKTKTHGKGIAWVLTIVGLGSWIFGVATSTQIIYEIGMAGFFAGAAFVAVSKTLIYQDSCNVEMKDELTKRFNGLEEKIDTIQNNKKIE